MAHRQPNDKFLPTHSLFKGNCKGVIRKILSVFGRCLLTHLRSVETPELASLDRFCSLASDDYGL